MSLFGSPPRSQSPNFMLNESPNDPASGSPDPPGSFQREESDGETLDDTQDHAPELVGPGFVGDSLDGPVYGSDLQRPCRKCLDISIDRFSSLDPFGAPPNPNNTPASYGEQVSNAPSDAGSCCAQDSHASVSKPENLSFGPFSPSQGVFSGYRSNQDEETRRRRLHVQSSSGSFSKPTFGVFSHSLGTLGYAPDEVNDTTPPLLRSPQFSLPSSLLSRSPIHLRGKESHSLDRKTPESPSTKRRKLSATRPKNTRRHRARRPFPFRGPAKTFHIPTVHTDRFPIPFPTIRNLPYRRESQVCRELTKPLDSSGGMRKIKKLVLTSTAWRRLRECAMIRLSLHKSLPAAPHSTYYLVYLRISRSTFSVKLSHTRESDKRTLSGPVLAVPTMTDGTMLLFQVSFFVPVAVLSVGRLAASGFKPLSGLSAMRGLASKVLGVVMALVECVVLLFLRVIGLGERVWLQVR